MATRSKRRTYGLWPGANEPRYVFFTMLEERVTEWAHGHASNPPPPPHTTPPPPPLGNTTSACGPDAAKAPTGKTYAVPSVPNAQSQCIALGLKLRVERAAEVLRGMQVAAGVTMRSIGTQGPRRERTNPRGRGAWRASVRYGEKVPVSNQRAILSAEGFAGDVRRAATRHRSMEARAKASGHYMRHVLNPDQAERRRHAASGK